MSTLGNPTLLQLRTRVRTFIDEISQANFTDASINYAINEAQQDVATEIAQATENYFVSPTPTVITTIANTPTYALAVDCWKPIRVINNVNGQRVEPGNFSQSNAPVNAGIAPIFGGGLQPFSFYLIGNYIGFTPTPTDTSVSFSYWYVPILPDMTADTDTSSIPRNFVDLLAMQAAMDMFIQDTAESNALLTRYNNKFNRLVRSVRDRQQAGPRRVSRTNQSGLTV